MLRGASNLLLLLLALAVAGVASPDASSPQEQVFVGPAQRGAALCPDDMVFVSAGAFLGGATPEQVELADYEPDIYREPRARGQHATAAYCIDRTEFPGPGRRPLADVTWVQARVACQSLGRRLCTEDEWSRGCGGPVGLLYPYGDRQVPGLCHADVWEQGSYDAVVPAGSSLACRSPYGTLDQEGNVSEWVEDGRPGTRDRFVLGGTMWPGVYGRGCQARHAHPDVAPVSGDDGFRCCRDPGLESP